MNDPNDPADIKIYSLNIIKEKVRVKVNIDIKNNKINGSVVKKMTWLRTVKEGAFTQRME